MTQPRYIFVTGGVSSSLGKGIAASSIARLLAWRYQRVQMVKIDAYLNQDPGTLSPAEHGEVYVTADGTEADLDLGNYERIGGVRTSRASSVTAGSIYREVLDGERAGRYLGKTVQIIPHVTDAIIDRLLEAGRQSDFVVAEIGGTVGDIEILPFLDAARQMRRVAGRNNVAYVHLALVPEVGPGRELKTKPVQHSVAALRERGIIADLLLCRSARPLDDNHKRKIALQADLPETAVLGAVDLDSIYDIPAALNREGLGGQLGELFNLPDEDATARQEWERITASYNRRDRSPLRVALIGKYVSDADAYLSIHEALRHAAGTVSRTAQVIHVDSDSLERLDPRFLSRRIQLLNVDAAVIAGGFGARSLEGKIAAAGACKHAGLPVLGICFGMQAMVIAAARSGGLENANSTEADPATPHPVVQLMNSQLRHENTGGTMRLGEWEMCISPGSVLAKMYNATKVLERHRHRYEINPDYSEALRAGGLHITAVNPAQGHIEGVENPDHPFYVGVQGHPEFSSVPGRAHPLFVGLLQAAAAGRAETVAV